MDFQRNALAFPSRISIRKPSHFTRSHRLPGCASAPATWHSLPRLCGAEFMAWIVTWLRNCLTHLRKCSTSARHTKFAAARIEGCRLGTSALPGYRPSRQIGVVFPASGVPHASARPKGDREFRSPAVAEILLAAVAQPDTEDLRDFLALGFAQGFIERDGLGALPAARGVAVRVPQAARDANAAANFLDQRLASERLRVLFLRRHGLEGERAQAGRKYRIG